LQAQVRHCNLAEKSGNEIRTYRSVKKERHSFEGAPP
jgi:hypothetical protein